MREPLAPFAAVEANPALHEGEHLLLVAGSGPGHRTEGSIRELLLKCDAVGQKRRAAVGVEHETEVLRALADREFA